MQRKRVPENQLFLFAESTIAAIASVVPAAIARIANLSWTSAKRPAPSLDAQTYTPYVPGITVPAGHAHPFAMMEPTTLAELSPAVPSGSCVLRSDVAENGELSVAQIDAVARVVASWKDILPDGYRAGFLLGDGTGAGKTRVMLSAAMQAIHETGKPAFIFTVKRDLLVDFREEFAALGCDPNDIVDIGVLSRGSAIPMRPVIYFGTYATLRQRGDDILASMGSDFDGMIAMDEAQSLRRAAAEPKNPAKGKRKNPELPWAGQSAQARMFVQMDEAVPLARLLYVSATAASSIEELRFARRLGLWGEGTVFANYEQFAATIEKADLSGYELVAHEVASSGRCISRTLSFEGIEYEVLCSALSPGDRERLDLYVSFFDEVNDGLKKVLPLTVKSPTHRGRFKGALTTARDKFIRMAYMRLRLDALLERVKEALDAGESVVVQIARTQEAALRTAIRNAQAEDPDFDDEDLTITGSQIIAKYLDEAFPTSKYIVDDESELIQAVDDTTGAIIEVAEAVEVRERLRALAAAFTMDNSVIDTIIDSLGGESAVAEFTGRKVRHFLDADGKRRVTTRTEKDIRRELQAFKDDEKRVLVISEAKGGTGISAHADRRWKNHRLRNHALLELGDRADCTFQGMGRSNRTNQVVPPRYIAVYADVPADRLKTEHFSLKMARLGALSRGDRKGANIAFFDPENNLVDDVAKVAFKGIVDNLRGAALSSPHRNLAEEVAKRAFDSIHPADIKNIKLENFLRDLAKYPLAAQEHFYAMLREFTEMERENQRASGATFGRVEAIPHRGFNVVVDEPLVIAHGRPVKARPGQQPGVRILGAVYSPKPATVGLAEVDARRTRVALPKHAPMFAEYHDATGHKFVPALVCGVWKTQSGSEMANVLTPLGYRKRNLEDFARLTEAAFRTKWANSVADISKPTTGRMWVVVGRVLSLEETRLNPNLVRIQTSDGKRLFGVRLGEQQAANLLARSTTASDASAIIATVAKAVKETVFAPDEPESIAA